MPRNGGEGPADSEERRTNSWAVPERLRSRLRPWLDLEAVGIEALWPWLESVLPLLPTPRDPPGTTVASGGGDRVRELARDLVDCASDRARLITSCEQYYRDNVGLARRVKALEAELRTGHLRPPPDDAGDASPERLEKYLPRR